MRCPYCNSTESQVRDSRPDSVDSSIRRRRICNECGAKFVTVERVQIKDLNVRKKNGTIEAFDREKLKKSIIIACKNRDIKEEKIEKMINSINRRLEMDIIDDTITSGIIGDMVSESLLNLDPIAFIRFVSVYKQFSKLADFKKLINEIPEKEEKPILNTQNKTSLF